jgi:site-specific DNA recombinase
VTRALAELREDREAGLYSSDLGKKEYRESFRRLEARREALLSAPSEPDRWEDEPTGETYRERFERLTDPADRNKELRESGVRVIVHAEELPPRLPLVTLGETEGLFRRHFGRVELTMPRDFYNMLRERTATT